MASNLMQKAYENAGELHFFFDKVFPIDLWRGQKEKDYKAGVFPLQPVTEKIELIIGNKKRVRLPDVEVFEKNGMPWIKGCRSTKKGKQHWGVSLFDKPPSFAKNDWRNFKIPQDTPIPESIAVTQDGDSAERENHYSICPKDDMPLSLFIQHLKEIAIHMTDW
ncbi:hypothetical protein V8J88_02210 [Massilia sp. W12]|uniref:Tse2 family ADP-ribosyltransferase toxin n=1 Tax=Massilia sp. W12 TaxID=3126507 RepID=UPI0030CBAFE6